MKPTGVTWDLRVRMPTRTEDAIWNAVEEAVSEGWTPQRFRAEVADAWEETLKRQAEEARKELLR